ncbi:MAG TPA: ubiquinone/menaquinone biosynthesis methyltransferase [Gemmatimonadaceae bacterium]|nr:ubiquinone/menaquinone biosynthesis methyltransferase [Gemmatimonadaceae bacterium]
MPSVQTERSEALAAAAGSAEKRAYVRSVFSQIAPRYDLLNHLLSFSIDKRWRRRAVAALRWDRDPSGVYVDLCAGTMDVANELARKRGFRGIVLGTDFAEPMLRAGRGKIAARPVAPMVADAVELPLRTGTASGAIVAFGARNLENLDAGLTEAFRVLRDGATFVILEFSMPRVPVVRSLYRLYFHYVLPALGRLVSRHPTAYRYLPASVDNFPNEEELVRRMTRAGFVNVRVTRLSFGIAAIHAGERRGEGATR